MKKDFMSSMKEKTAVLRPSLLSTEENIKQQIQILDDLRQLIPPLREEELEQLKRNVLNHGIKDPLTVWETTSTTAGINDQNEAVFILVDGHNRYLISRQFSLDYRINLVHFATLAEVRDYMLDYQLGRRNLTPEQVSYLRGLRYLQQKSMRGGNKLTESARTDVSAALGKEYGVSSRTIKRDGDFAAGLDKLAPELKQQVLSGEKKIAKSFLATVAKTENPDAIEKTDSSIGQSESTESDTKTKPAQKRISKLEAGIRELAAGNLNRKTCRELMQKIQVLIELIES